MRLDKFMTMQGYGSKKQVKRIIYQRKVEIDSEIVLKEGFNVDPAIHKVTIGTSKFSKPVHVYYMLNKPNGVVSAVKDSNYQTSIDLISKNDQREGLYPIGRLDRDTEGLQILTTNGLLGHELLMPYNKVIKKYRVLVNGKITEEDVSAFKNGIKFCNGFQCKQATLTPIDTNKQESLVEVEISEGQLHQVKKMFLSVGKKVSYLKRLSMGPIDLDSSLNNGSYRPLTNSELQRLKPYFNQKRDNQQ